MKCKMKDCKKETFLNGYCKKHWKERKKMQCYVCGQLLSMFIGNPNKEKNRKRNFCYKCGTEYLNKQKVLIKQNNF